MPLLHLDYETFNTQPFGRRKDSVGLWNYLTHPSAEVVLAGFGVDGGEVEVLEGFMPLRLAPNSTMVLADGMLELPWTDRHDFLLHALDNPAYDIVCYNAGFERLATANVVGLDVPTERFLCSMAYAWHMSFAGDLEEVTRNMDLPQDRQKLARAKRMMQKFCTPRRPSKTNPATRWFPEDDPGGWGEFKEYCAQDVVASRAIMDFGAQHGYEWHPTERRMWCLDQDINDHGWPIDMGLVTNANRVRVKEQDRLLQEMNRLTGLDNANSDHQLKPWLAERGVELPNLQAETVQGYLDFVAGTDCEHNEVATLFRLRQQLKAATPKKLDALQRTVHEGRAKATLAFAAGQRTQRWGGRVIQTQNLYSEREYDVDMLADLFTCLDHRTLYALFNGNLMRPMKGVIRPCIAAPEGYVMPVVDLSSIESRLLGWHSGEERINGIFRRGEDTYKDLASRIFGKPVPEVSKAERTFAKPPELGCGYGLGGRGLVAYAGGMGVDMDQDTADRVVGIWRESNPAVVRMWEWLRAATQDTLSTWNSHAGYGVRVHRDERFLLLDLPSGRSIHYYKPEIRPNDWGSPSLTYMGRYQEEGGRWQRVFTHPGKIVENIIQAVARDILRDALLSAWLNGIRIVGHVHDEIVALCRLADGERILALLVKLMSTVPEYLPGLLLAAEGELVTRYRKL